MVKMEYLSMNVVNIMKELSQDDVLAQYLLNAIPAPLDVSLPSDWKSSKLINPSDEYCRISPTPFDPNAQEKDKSFLRVYYNTGEFDKTEVITESSLHIDIVVAKSLWLMHNTITNRSLIRPYEIMGRVIDCVGRRSMNGEVQVGFSGWQLLSVNTQFDALRLYSDSWSVEE